ncbi:F-box only protein 42 isoform X2 [Nematostella vectensis]|uniref:F-box only protein 42 isoform X2 n=1 Tax=Nematostella vectensis TaxID=45351 RepID=UPI002076FE37|nr:F-box only protein 42 isoform X2 [Nematostella vectensis]
MAEPSTSFEDGAWSSVISRLPAELIEKILMFLSSYGDLEQARLVCRVWNRLVSRIIQQRLRRFYECVANGKLNFKVVPNTSRFAPSPRFSHGCCVSRNSMYIFGGCSPSNTAFNDVFELDLKDHKWTRLRISGSPPPPKECATMVAHKKRVIVFGGWCQPSRTGFNDVWVLDLNDMQWSTPLVRGRRPSGRFGHSQVAVNDKTILIIGGCGGPNMLFSDVWLLDLIQWRWQEIEVRNQKWEAPQLWCHPAVLVQDKVVAFSIPRQQSQDSSNHDNLVAHVQTYILDCSKLLTQYFCSWMQPGDNYKAPLATSLHSVVVGRAEFVIFGGIQYSLRQSNSQNVTNVLVSVTPR